MRTTSVRIDGTGQKSELTLELHESSETTMRNIERLELEAHRAQLEADVKHLIDKFLAIAEWDVPGIDEPLANRLIIAAIRLALDKVEHALANSPPA